MTAAREAQRQQRLLDALQGDADAVAGWLRPGDAPRLQAYRGNAAAIANRALSAAFPTLRQLVGDATFAALARAHWHVAPPLRGDLGEWGADLAAAVACDRQLAEVPYLTDVARLDWAVHQAERAADAGAPRGLEAVSGGDPATLRLLLAPGTAVVASPHPIVTLWQAHRSSDAGRFEPARQAIREEHGETALVRRAGWRADVRAIAGAEAAFTTALLVGAALGQALDAAGPAFGFEDWLVAALRAGAIAAVA